MQQFLNISVAEWEAVVQPHSVLDDDHWEAVSVGLGVGHGWLPYPSPVKATQPLEVTPDDVVVVFTLRRYSRATTRMIRALHKQGVQVLLITDQGASPLNKIAHQCLQVPTQGTDVLASVAPFVSVVTLLASLVAHELEGGHLKQAEALNAEFGVYEY
ncbi:MurR/RpiR family transcriptional regulator [Deinococcus frigens]|uniref:MurR/RpiR family transcriptional regulator n=1 Tax=Deinococcus frigens TaxID=249403 RepID=UPI0039F0474E